MRRLFFLLAFLSVPSVALAQTSATPASKFVFDQIAPDLATANGYTYRYYADAATVGATLTAVCTGTASPFTCSAPIPAFTPGSHAVTITAANIGGESAKSAPLSFTFVVVPAPPTGLRIQ